MSERRCWYCGKKRPNKKPGNWTTIMGWAGPKGQRKRYVLYGCGDHRKGMQDAFEHYVIGWWKPKHERG